MSKILRKTWVQYSLIYGLFLIVLIKVKITGGDDELYKSIIHNRNFFDWLVELYQRWSGRVVLTGLLALILNIPILIWKFVTAGFFTLLIALFEKLTHPSLYVRWLSVALILLIPSPILNSSAFWITGSLNYLWAYVSMMGLFYLVYARLHHKEFTIFSWVLSYGAALLAANNEQTGLVISVFFILVVFYQVMMNKHWDVKLLCLGLFSVLNFMFLMLAPGNYLRYTAEMLRYAPNFLMLDRFDQLVIGFNYSFEMLFNSMKLFMLLISISLVLFTSKDKYAVRILSWISLLYIVFKLLMDYIIVTYPYCTQCNDLHYMFFTFKYLNLNYNERLSLYLPILGALGYVSSVGLVLLHSKARDFETRGLMALLWIGSILSSVILGFSPTIDASGNRIYFVMAMGVVLILVYLLSEIEASQDYPWIINALTILLMYEALQIAFTYYNVFDFTVIY